MSVLLKNDWEAVGSSASAKKMAEWMNMVANQFNGASIPSGGTAQATTLGFQIEVDADTNGPYHFEVIRGVVGKVDVRGGKGILSNGGVGFVKAPRKVGGVDKVNTDDLVPFDMTSDTGDIEIWAVLTPPVSATPAYLCY